MSVRKRKWTNKNGKTASAWIVDYGAKGKRHLRTFTSKSEATAFHASLPPQPRRNKVMWWADLSLKQDPPSSGAAMSSDDKLNLLIEKMDRLLSLLRRMRWERRA
jgi:hypothetical protein